MNLWQLRVTFFMILGLALAGGLPDAAATDGSWQNTGGGSFNVAGNWVANTIPDGTSVATFSSNATYAVTFAADVLNARASFTATGGTVTNNAGAYTWTLTNSFQIGASGTAAGNVVMLSGTVAVTNAGGTAALSLSTGHTGNSLTLTNGAHLISNNATNGASTFDNSLMLVTGSSTTWSNSNAITLGTGTGADGHAIRVENGATVVNVGGLTIADRGNNNSVTVTGGGSSWTNSGLITIGSFNPGNSMVATNGGHIVSTNVWVGGSAGSGAGNNLMLVSGDGSVWNNTGTITIGKVGNGNQLRIEDRGRLDTAALFMSESASSGYDTTTVTGASSLLNVGELRVGDFGSNNVLVIKDNGRVNANSATLGYQNGTNAQNNLIWVQDAGSLFSNVTLLVGRQDPYNRVVVTNGAQLITGSLIVGAAQAGSNSVLVVNGGLLDANSLTAFNTVGNTISNRNATYQFTTNSPTIAPNGAGRIAITDGTISFRGIANADVTNNLGNGALSGISFAGANTFLLNASSNNTAGQTYTFGTSQPNGPSNYVNLVMMNGATAYRGGDLTIGATGSMLVSSTVATISGIVTNQGSLTVAAGTLATFQGAVVNTGTGMVRSSSVTVNGLFTNAGVISFLTSVGTFNSAVINSGSWISDPSTNVFHATYTVTSSGTIGMAAGDVYEFARTNATTAADFVNLSKSNTTYNTVLGKFVYSSTVGLTQTFFTAGLDLGPGGTYAFTPGYTNNLGGAGRYGSGPTTNNFALGTLEISNYSTVQVSDAFLVGPLDDHHRAALYVSNLVFDVGSLLIVDTNVTVYYFQSSGWTAANFAVLPGGEFHLLVPEPNVLLLLLSGAGLVQVMRRRKR